MKKHFISQVILVILCLVFATQFVSAQLLDEDNSKTLRGEGIQLTIPDTFEGGDIEENLDDISDAMLAFDPSLETMVELIRQNPEVFIFYAYDPTITPAFLTNIIVTKTEVPMELTLDEYYELYQQAFDSTFEFLSGDVGTISIYDALRMEIVNETLESHQLVYVIQNDNTYYEIAYSMHLPDAEELIPVFEESAETFSLSFSLSGVMEEEDSENPIGLDPENLELVEFESEQIRISLPERFRGGDLAEQIDAMEELAGTMGPEFEQILELASQNPDIYEFYAFDTRLASNGGLINVNVTSVPGIPKGLMPLNQLATEIINQFPFDVEVIEEESVVEVSDYEAGRAMIEWELNGLLVNQLLYLFIENDTLFAVSYTAGGEDFEHYLPIFEMTIDTIEFKGTQ